MVGGLTVIGILTFLVIVTIFMGVRIVPQGYKHVVQRLGKYHTTLNPGLNFVIPYLDTIAHKVIIHRDLKLGRRIDLVDEFNQDRLVLHRRDDRPKILRGGWYGGRPRWIQGLVRGGVRAGEGRRAAGSLKVAPELGGLKIAMHILVVVTHRDRVEIGIAEARSGAGSCGHRDG